MENNIISKIDNYSYLILINELKKYFKDYYLEYKGFKYNTFSIIGISYYNSTIPCYKVQIDICGLYDYENNTEMNMSGNITMLIDEFDIFIRTIKIKKIKKLINNNK